MNISSSGSCLPLTFFWSGQISGLCIDFFFFLNLELKFLNWKVIIIILKTFWRLSRLVDIYARKLFVLSLSDSSSSFHILVIVSTF